MKEDQRTVLTKRLLQEGLLRLLKKKEMGKIRVTELCAESGINRATFYRHYQQPRDILTEMRREVFRDIQALVEKDASEKDPLRWLEAVCSYFYAQREVLNTFFRSRTDDEFVQLINELCIGRSALSHVACLGRDLDESSVKLAAYYYSGGIFYILRQWLSEPIDKTPKEVAALIARFSSTGCRTIL